MEEAVQGRFVYVGSRNQGSPSPLGMEPRIASPESELLIPDSSNTILHCVDSLFTRN